MYKAKHSRVVVKADGKVQWCHDSQHNDMQFNDTHRIEKDKILSENDIQQINRLTVENSE